MARLHPPPGSLDVIQVRTVWRQPTYLQAILVFLEKGLDLFGMVKAAIIGDHQDVMIRVVFQECFQVLNKVGATFGFGPVCCRS